MKPLFGYGTFRKTAWRNAILGAEYPWQPATLRGYRRIACGSGYLSLRETLVALMPVEGVLIELDELGWEIADRWEEVPKYSRAEVVVDTMHGRVEAWTYVATDEGFSVPVDDDRYALIPDLQVEASIAIFAKTVERLRRRSAG